MNILHLVDSGGLYGAENVILNLSREMIHEGTFTPTIGCIVSHVSEQNDLFDRAVALKIPVVRVVIRNSLLPRDLFKFLFQCKKLGIDLIHSHGYKPSVFAFMIGLVSRIQVTATCHLWFLGKKRPLKQRVMTRMELLCYRFYPVITAVSQPIRLFLLQHRISMKQLRIIKNGIIMDDYPLRKTLGHESFPKFASHCTGNSHGAFSAEGQQKCDEIIIINVGRLSPQKNQKILLRAAKVFDEQNVPLTWLIVGEGELRETLKQEIKALELEGKVSLPGFQKDIHQLLTKASVFVLPSLDEGMPISLLEAIAVGVPVIVTPVGDIPNLIVHGRSGLVVTPHDVQTLVHGIKFLLTNPDTGLEMALNARRLLEKQFSSKTMFKAYVRVYEIYRSKINKIDKGRNQ